MMLFKKTDKKRQDKKLQRYYENQKAQREAEHVKLAQEMDLKDCKSIKELIGRIEGGTCLEHYHAFHAIHVRRHTVFR